MAGITIVAIPDRSDSVWKLSSEKIPHLTICQFEGNFSEDVSKYVKMFVKRASRGLKPFYLDVTHMGELGSDKAQVLFLKSIDLNNKNYSVDAFRDNLLQDFVIKRLQDMTSQYQSWNKHLTIGYPDSPPNFKAFDDDRPIPSSIWFKTIAVWDGDYKGLEIPLAYDNKEVLEHESSTKVLIDHVSMHDDIALSKGQSVIEHYGVLGMKWGVRKDRIKTSGSTSSGDKIVVKARKGKGITSVSGASRRLPSEDAIKAAAAKAKASRSSLDSLSNDELKSLITRIKLESQYKELTKKKKSAGAKFVKSIIDSEINSFAKKGKPGPILDTAIKAVGKRKVRR